MSAADALFTRTIKESLARLEVSLLKYALPMTLPTFVDKRSLLTVTSATWYDQVRARIRGTDAEIERDQRKLQDESGVKTKQGERTLD